MQQIAGANLLRLGIVLGIVIAVRKAQPALPHTHNHGIGVIGILLGAAVEEQGIAGKMQTSYQRRKIVNAFDRLHLVERRLHGFGAKLLHRRFVHTCGVVIADLLGDGVRGLGGGCLFENSPQIVEIILVQLGINVPTDLVGGNGILLLPAAAGVLVEIHAWVQRSVHGRNIEAGDVRQGRLDSTLGRRGRIAGIGSRRGGRAGGLLSECCQGDKTE